MRLFETIKETVTVGQAAEYYGMKIGRNNMICCPFHNDHHPSMKLNTTYYYCFGCGATGDMIQFVANLFGLSNYEAAKKFVVDNGLDVGFAYDGDADRCIAVDENGNVVDGDRIMYVCGKYLMEQGKLKDNTVVTTIMSNLGLYKACDKIGMKYEQTAVGDKYVYENMLKNGYVLGGEQSGHIIFSKHARTGDGILTSLMVMEAIIEKKQTLGTLADEVKIFPQLLKNVRVKDKKTALDNAAVQAAVEKTAEELGTDGRILVRESGTEPVIRVMVEAASDEICEKYVDSVVKVIESEGLCE